MIDTYKGESWAKKLTRYNFWATAINGRRWVFPRDRILVLASREMGDYSRLLSTSEQLASAVIAVDRCEEAVVAARSKFPDADVRHCEVDRVQIASNERIAVAFLDFCSPLCPEVMVAIRATVSKMRPGSKFGVGLLRGRERDGGSIIAKHAIRNRREARTIASVMRQQKLSADSCGLGTARDIVAGYSEQDPAIKRALAVAVLASNPLVKTNELLLTDVFNYQSSTKDSRGVPMSYALYDVVSHEFRHNYCSHRFDIDAHEASVVTESHVRDAALELEARNVDSALALNVSKGTIAAWKAHATRGTYEAAE